MTRYHSRNGRYQKDVTSPELFCAPVFRQSYHLIDDIVLTGLIIIEKAVSIAFFSSKVML